MTLFFFISSVGRHIIDVERKKLNVNSLQCRRAPGNGERKEASKQNLTDPAETVDFRRGRTDFILSFVSPSLTSPNQT